jgi:malonate-semialdehyde dehydrogenase (acetylating) / methylmalonate-semialdehyde dehydrogenase
MQEVRREVRNFVGGRWEERDGRETEPVYDPATGQVIAETPLSSREDVDRAVEAAEAAFPEWSRTPVVKRTQVLFRYKMLLDEHFEELRDIVTLENGKDAGGEVRRGIEVVEFACGMPTLTMGETVRDVAHGVDNASYRFPLGVVAAITPFNFPCMIPLWTLPIAIGAGNTYIRKPSERTPLCSQRLGELLMEAGLPEGVFNIVNGAHDAVNGILEHPGIKAVSFVGSKPVAEHVYKHGAAHGKRVQALAGAKNSMIVMPDVVLDKAVENIISSAYCDAKRPHRPERSHVLQREDRSVRHSDARKRRSTGFLRVRPPRRHGGGGALVRAHPRGVGPRAHHGGGVGMLALRLQGGGHGAGDRRR